MLLQQMVQSFNNIEKISLGRWVDMSSLDNDIINYLRSKSHIKARDLAMLLNITTRTVRNHIKVINQKFPG